MGRHSYVSDGAITTPVTIGNFTSIAPGVRMHERIQHPCATDPLLASTATNLTLAGYPRARKDDGITIGHDVWIGREAVLMGHLTIGDGAIIGAYSVVAKDVPPYAVVVGNPASVIRYRYDAPTIAALLRLQWWHWPDAVIAERRDALHDVRLLVARYGYDEFAEPKE